MAFRLVSSGGNVTDPAIVSMHASGVIRPGMVVQHGVALAAVSAAISSSPSTAIIGVSLDYAQGFSDTFVRVIPFAPGQIWEADCVSAVTTLHVLRRHRLGITDPMLLENAGASTVNEGESVSSGVFFAYALTGATTGSGKLLGTFLTGRQAHRGTDSVNLTF